MNLTPFMLQRIDEILRRHHAAIAVDVFGESSIPPAARKELEELGMIEGMDLELLTRAHVYGKHIGSKPTDEGKVDLHEVLKNIPLSAAEKNAMALAQAQAGQYITAIGTGAAKDTYQALTRNATANKVLTRQGMKSFVSELGNLTQDWGRNLDRVAITESHNAQQTGLAADYGEGNKDPWVSVVPQPGACKHCKRLHLGPDGAPRIVRLSSLAPAGANVGRKVADWVATVGSVHPHCQCQLQRIPNGWGWDEAGTLVPGGEFGVQYQSAGELQKALVLEQDHSTDMRKAFLSYEREMNFQGLPITIETEAGSQRFWYDRAAGESGCTITAWPYGEIKNTLGSDGDPIDVYIGPSPYAPSAYVVHQRKRQKDGSFRGYDETKCMLGFSSKAEAQEAYLLHYDDPRFLGSIEAMPMSEFKRWAFSRESRSKQPAKTKTMRLTVRDAQGIAPNAPEPMEKATPVQVRPRKNPTLTVTLQKARNVQQATAVDAPLTVMQDAPGGAANIQMELPPKPIHKFDTEGVRDYLRGTKIDPKVTRVLNERDYAGMNANIEFKLPLTDAQENYKTPIRGGDAEDPDDIQANRDNIARVHVGITDAPENTTELYGPPNVGPFENSGAGLDPKLEKTSPWDDIDALIKGANHKYLKRLLTGKAKPKYQYIYSVNSKHHGNTPQKGEKVKITHDGKVGHYEIHETKDGKVTMRHDESNHELTVKHDELRSLFSAEHSEQVNDKHEDLRDVARKAKKFGTKAQKEKAKADLAQFQTHHDIDPNLDEKDRFSTSHAGIVKVYQAILEAAGVTDHDSAQADNDYSASRKKGSVRKQKELAWAGMDAFNEKLGRKKPLTSVLHGFEAAINKLKIKRWQDLGPVLEMMRDVPGMGKVQLPQEKLEEHAQDERQAKEKADLKPEDFHKEAKEPDWVTDHEEPRQTAPIKKEGETAAERREREFAELDDEEDLGF